MLLLCFSQYYQRWISPVLLLQSLSIVAALPVLILLPACSSIPSSTYCGSVAVSPPWPAPNSGFRPGLTNPAPSIADLFMVTLEIETQTVRANEHWLILLFFLFAFSNVGVSGNKWPRFDCEDISKCMVVLKHLTLDQLLLKSINFVAWFRCQKKRTYSNDSTLFGYKQCIAKWLSWKCPSWKHFLSNSDSSRGIGTGGNYPEGIMENS